MSQTPAPSKRKALTIGEVFEQTLFLAPACGGLVLIGLAMLWGSAFEWILICAYVVGLPILFFYVRTRPPVQKLLGPRQKLTAMAVSLTSGDLKALGQALHKAKNDPNLDDSQVDRANLQYRATYAVFRQFCKDIEILPPLPEAKREAILAVGQRCLSALFDDLRLMLTCFDRLRGYDTAALLKKSQKQKPRTTSVEHSREEHQHLDKLAERSDIFGEILLLLDRSEKLVTAFHHHASRLPSVNEATADAAIREMERLRP